MFTSTLNILDPSRSTAVEPHRTRAPETAPVDAGGEVDNLKKEEDKSGLKKIEQEIATAAGLVRPLNTMAMPALDQNGLFFDELLRAIENLQNPDKSHMVDVFE